MALAWKAGWVNSPRGFESPYLRHSNGVALACGAVRRSSDALMPTEPVAAGTLCGMTAHLRWLAAALVASAVVAGCTSDPAPTKSGPDASPDPVVQALWTATAEHVRTDGDTLVLDGVAPTVT